MDSNPILPFACVCILENKDGLYLSVSRRNHPELIGFPGGKRDPGEFPEACIRRELLEETGITATDMYILTTQTDDDGHLVTTYVVTEWTGVPQSVESGLTVRWADRKELTDPSMPFPSFNAACLDILERHKK